MSAKSSNYKIVINPTGNAVVSDLDGQLHNWPAFDGFFVNIKTAAHKTSCINVCTQNTNLEFWRYYNILEYPFSEAVGGTTDEFLNWVRRNIQFTGANPGTTNLRMKVSGTPDTVVLSQLYFTGPSAPVSCGGSVYLGSSAAWEFQELWHWYGMDSTTAASIVTKMVDLADDIQAGAGVFLDQCWLRGWGWFWGAPGENWYSSCTPTPTFQSGHGADEDDTPVLAGADDSDIAAAYGESSTWQTWRDNIQYFFGAIDTALPNMALKNGEWRQAYYLNGYETMPAPYYIEGANVPLISGQSLTSAMAVWDDDDYNVIGFRVFDYANLQSDLDDLISAWVDRGGGYIALEASDDTDCGWGETTFLSVWNQLVAVGQGQPGGFSSGGRRMGSRTDRRSTRNMRLGWDRTTVTHTGGTTMEAHVINSDGTLNSDAISIDPYELVTVAAKVSVTAAPTSLITSVQESVDGGTTWVTLKRIDSVTTASDNGPAMRKSTASESFSFHFQVMAPLIRLRFVSAGCDGDNYFTVDICRVMANCDGDHMRLGADPTTLTAEGQTINGEDYNSQGMTTATYRRMAVLTTLSAVTGGNMSYEVSPDGGTTWLELSTIDGLAAGTELYLATNMESAVHLSFASNLMRIVHTSISGDMTMSHARVALRR